MSTASDAVKKLWKTVPNSTKALVGGGAAVGAVGHGYAQHKQRKGMTAEQRKQSPGVFIAGLNGAMSGAQTGAAIAVGKHLSKETGQKRYLLGTLGSTAAGAAGGAALGGRKADRVNERKKKGLWPDKHFPKIDRKASILSGALKGAEFGAGIGSLHAGASYMKNQRESMKAKMRGKPARGSKIPDWVAGATSKADAAKRYKTRAREVHPDLATNPVEKVKRTKQFQDLSADWSTFQKSEHFDKLSAALSTYVSKEAPQAAKKGWSWAKKNLRPRKLKYHAMTNQSLQGGAIGAAGGGLLGAAGGAIAQPDREKGESRKKNALKGALGGAALGGVVGHAYGRMQKEMDRSMRFAGGFEHRQEAKLSRLRKQEKAAQEAARKARQDARHAKWSADVDAWRKGGGKGPMPKIEFEVPRLDLNMDDVWRRISRDSRADDAKAGVRKFFGKGKPKTSSVHFPSALVTGFFAELIEIGS